MTPPGGDTVRLFAPVLSHPGPSGPDSLLFFSGGPGDGATDDLSAWASSPALGRRDVVLLDQLGTGR